MPIRTLLNALTRRPRSIRTAIRTLAATRASDSRPHKKPRPGYWPVLLVFILLLIAGLEQTAEAQNMSESDSKAWLGATGRIDVTRPFRIQIEHQQRLSAADGVERSLAEVAMRYRLRDVLKLTAAYRTTATYGDGLRHRGALDIGLGHNIGRLGLAYRLRLQSTIRPDKTTQTIRNKIGADYNLKGPITPGVAAEVHYSLTNSEFRETRWMVGADYKLSKRLRIGAYYMNQFEYNKRIEERNHVLRLGLTYVFRKAKAR